jgi:hypothetical protein
VRLDLRLGEVPRERLDLPLIAGQGEVHAGASLAAPCEIACGGATHADEFLVLPVPSAYPSVERLGRSRLQYRLQEAR